MKKALKFVGIGVVIAAAAYVVIKAVKKPDEDYDIFEEDDVFEDDIMEDDFVEEAVNPVQEPAQEVTE